MTSVIHGPITATIAAVVKEKQILLVRRRNRPDAGRWAFPGGKVRLGESLVVAARRELMEEAAVHAEPRRVFAAVDVFDRQTDGALHRHFVLVAIQFDWQSGEPIAGDDALEARWFTAAELAQADLARSFDVAAVAQQALEHGRVVSSHSHPPMLRSSAKGLAAS